MDVHTRRMEILEILKNRNKVTAFELAKRFSVSVNTIKSDLSYLSQKFQIYSEYGCRGGYRFVGERTIEITEEEAELLANLLRAHQSEVDADRYFPLLGKLGKYKRNE